MPTTPVDQSVAAGSKRLAGLAAFRANKSLAPTQLFKKLHALDEVVWQQVIRLIEEPELIQCEIERRIQAIRESDPSQRREAALRQEQMRLRV